jgi:hypothetical protein
MWGGLIFNQTACYYHKNNKITYSSGHIIAAPDVRATWGRHVGECAEITPVITGARTC